MGPDLENLGFPCVDVRFDDRALGRKDFELQAGSAAQLDAPFALDFTPRGGEEIFATELEEAFRSAELVSQGRRKSNRNDHEQFLLTLWLHRILVQLHVAGRCLAAVLLNARRSRHERLKSHPGWDHLRPLRRINPPT